MLIVRNYYDYDCRTAPYSHPQNFSAVATSSTSITLTWLPPPAHLINGVLRYYHLLISNSAGENFRDILLDQNLLEVLIEGLQPYFQYNCTMAAVTVEEGPLTSVQIQTLEDSETCSI